MSRTRLSRRDFVLSSVATGVAGIVSPHAKPTAAASASDSHEQWLTFELSGDREQGYGVLAGLLVDGKSQPRLLTGEMQATESIHHGLHKGGVRGGCSQSRTENESASSKPIVIFCCMR